jgi:hypothetical protein
MLDGGPTLSGRIAALDSSLRKSYQLDQLLDQYMNLQNQGVGLEGRLTDYIRGRDEFLNETDGMLEDFKDKMLTMNMADPETAASAEMYSGYLYELRGRQNKRYVEFLNSSIDQYNNKLTSMSNMYTTALDGYQRELQTKAAITQEEYGLMFNGLTEMYNNVANAPMQALEMEKMQYELYGAYQKAIGDGTSGLTSGQDYLKALDNLKKVGAIHADGSWNPNMSFSDADLYESLGVSDRANFFTAMLDVGRRSMTTPDKDGIFPGVDKVLQTGNSIMEAVYNFNSTGQISAEQALGATDQIRDSIANALYRNGAVSTTQAPTIKSAVDFLSSKNPGVFNLKKAPTREQFTSEFDGQLDRRFLDSLYTDFEGYLSNPAEFAKYFLVDPQGQPLTDEGIVSRLTYSFAEKLGRSNLSDFKNVGGDTNQASRPVRNNNPLNIKGSSTTATYPGVVGYDPSPAQDGGYFLQFSSPDSGFAAAQRLITGSGYRGLTVDKAMRRWSGGGYGGEIAPSIANKVVGNLSQGELQSLLQTMAKREGYYG